MAVAVANDGASGVFDRESGMVTLFQVGNSTPIGRFSFDSMAVSPTWASRPLVDANRDRQERERQSASAPRGAFSSGCWQDSARLPIRLVIGHEVLLGQRALHPLGHGRVFQQALHIGFCQRGEWQGKA